MIKSVKYTIMEHVVNFRQIIAMSISSTRRHFVGTSLGIFWSLYKDIVYLFTYYVFMSIVMSGSSVDGVPRIIYLISGLLPWFFISECLTTGSKAIIRNKSIITKIKFPISIIPTYETLSIFYRRALTYIFGFAIFAFMRYLGDFNIFLFIYYNFAMIVLMAVFTQFISGIVAISKDFEELYSSITRIIFFFLPIIWSFVQINNMGENGPLYAKIAMANPLVYPIVGFRESFGFSDVITMNYHIYFWVFVLVLFVIGSHIQNNLKRFYADFL